MAPTLASFDLAVAGTGPIIAVEQRDNAIRDTAPHAHASGQLIGSLAGLLSVSTPEGAWVIPATHAIWIPPHRTHSLRSHGMFAGWSVYVEEASCASLPCEPRTMRVSGLLREAAHRASSWCRPPIDAPEQRVAAVILDEIGTLPAEPLGLLKPRDRRAARIAEAILSDLADGRAIAAWATWGKISPRTLARRFADETGFGITAWRQRARALRAVELLSEGVPVTTIALDLGYENVSTFVTMFRRTLGTTPGRYGR